MCRLGNKIQVAGFSMLMIGAAGMDSPNITAPVIMIATGLGILLVSSLKEKSLTQQLTKAKRKTKSKKITVLVFYYSNTIERKMQFLNVTLLTLDRRTGYGICRSERVFGWYCEGL